MPVAMDASGKYIKIGEITDQNRHNEYRCIACGGIVIPKSIEESNEPQPYFAHKAAEDCSIETLWHKFYKDWLLLPGNEFCLECDNSLTSYTVERVEFEQSYVTPFGSYTPDITVYTTSGERLFIEIDYSSRKKPDDYIAEWRYLESTVSEVSVKKFYKLDNIGNLRNLSVIYKDGCYCGNYKEKHAGDKYGDFIIKNEKYAVCLENIDWFWCSLRYYYNGAISEDAILSEFELLDRNDQDVALRLCDTLNCVDLKSKLIELRNNDFSKFVSELFSHELHYYDPSLKVTLIHITPKKYRVSCGKIYSSESEYYKCVNIPCVSKTECVYCEKKCIYKQENSQAVIKMDGRYFTHDNFEHVSKYPYTYIILECLIHEAEYIKKCNREIGLCEYSNLPRISFQYACEHSLSEQADTKECMLKSKTQNTEIIAYYTQAYDNCKLIIIQNVELLESILRVNPYNEAEVKKMQQRLVESHYPVKSCSGDCHLSLMINSISLGGYYWFCNDVCKIVNEPRNMCERLILRVMALPKFEEWLNLLTDHQITRNEFIEKVSDCVNELRNSDWVSKHTSQLSTVFRNQASDFNKEFLSTYGKDVTFEEYRRTYINGVLETGAACYTSELNGVYITSTVILSKYQMCFGDITKLCEIVNSEFERKGVFK
jgi:hypothetical protein